MIIKKRKDEHLEVCLNKDVEYKSKTTGFEHVELIYKGFPEVNFEEIDLSTEFLGKKIDYPLNISGMVGGTKKGKEINENLAKAAEELNISMGIGSQRIAIENPEFEEGFKVRKYAPTIPLIGNLGAVQLNKGYTSREIIKAKKMIDGDAIALHSNPAQEVFQENGDKDFSELLEKIEKIQEEVEFPIIIKEVGHGFSKEDLEELERIGISIVDLQGAGGTNFLKVESLRSGKNVKPELLEMGVPTCSSLLTGKKNTSLSLIASGGIRSGLEVAKAISIGADLCGLALPLLKPATISPEVVKEKLKEIIEELKITMFLTGANNLEELRENYILKGKLKQLPV